MTDIGLFGLYRLDVCCLCLKLHCWRSYQLVDSLLLWRKWRLYNFLELKLANLKIQIPVIFFQRARLFARCWNPRSYKQCLPIKVAKIDSPPFGKKWLPIHHPDKSNPKISRVPSSYHIHLVYFTPQFFKIPSSKPALLWIPRNSTQSKQARLRSFIALKLQWISW